MPSADNTFAFGIYGSDIVGADTSDVMGVASDGGYLYDGRSYTALSVPGAVETDAQGISGKNIVGFFSYGGQAVGLGFLYDGTNYTTLSVPGAKSAVGTRAYGISGNNIVGSYYNGTNFYSFLYNGTNYTTLSVPGASGTFAQGISGNNIVGNFTYPHGQTNMSFLATLAQQPIVLNSVVLDNGNLILSGINGSAFASYRVLTSTNICMPVTSWTAIATNSFDGSGNFKFTNVVDLTIQALFFDIASP